MDVIKCANHVIDLGPEGGKTGGQLVCAGTPEEIAACEASYTGRFLRKNWRWILLIDFLFTADCPN